MAELVDYNNNDINIEEQYSTEEQWTGKYWIDGKKIYRKVVYISSTNQTHGITDLKQVISLSAMYYRSNTYGWTDGSNDVTIQTSTIYFLGDIAENILKNGYNSYVIIEYIKNSD